MLTLLKILLIAYTVSRIEPVTWFLDALQRKYDYLIIPVASLLLTCFKCLSLWIGIAFGEPYLGMIASIIATIYEKYLSGWEKILVD